MDAGMDALHAAEAGDVALLAADHEAAMSDVSDGGGSDAGGSDADVPVIEIFDHDIDPENLIWFPKLGVPRETIGDSTPAAEKLLLPPISGCRLQRRETDSSYQAWYPVDVVDIDGPQSHSRTWGALLTMEDSIYIFCVFDRVFVYIYIYTR